MNAHSPSDQHEPEHCPVNMSTLSSHMGCDHSLLFADLTDVVSSRAAALKQGSRNGESIGNIVRQAQEGSVVPGAALDEQHVTDIRMAIAAHLTARLRRHITKMLDFTLSAGACVACKASR
jgi:hypothetical protein